MHSRAGVRALPEDLIDLDGLIGAYYQTAPDVSNPAQKVVFGTSGHRGSSLDGGFNENHILAVTQAVVEQRAAQGITGPIFVGRDTHGLSEPAFRSVLEVLLRFGFDQPTAYQLLYCVATKDVNERRNAVIAPLTKSCFQRTQDAVEAAMAAGQMRKDMPARVITEALIAACHGLIAIRLANPVAPWSEPEVQIKVLLDGLFDGFASK